MLIDTLDRPLTLHQYLIYIDMSVDSQLTLDRHLGSTLVKSLLIFADMLSRINQYIWVGQHSAVYCPTQSNVHQVLIEILTECQPSVAILIKCWVRYRSSVDRRSIEGIDRHLTMDAFSIHYPSGLGHRLELEEFYVKRSGMLIAGMWIEPVKKTKLGMAPGLFDPQ